MLYGALGLLGFVTCFARQRFSNIQKILGWIGFFLVFAVLALRHQSMGIDLGYNSGDKTGYLDSFDMLSRLPWPQILQTTRYRNYEWGYILLNKLIGSIWRNRQFFLAVCAALSVWPVAAMTMEKSDSPLLACVIYLALPVFELLFSGLRQGIALGICCLALRQIRERRPLRFLAAVGAAWLLHDTAFIFLLAYPLYHIRVPKVLRLVSILLIPLVFLFRVPLFGVLRLLFQKNAAPDYNGALNLLILLTGIYGICSLFIQEEDAEYSGYLNLFFLCCLCQVFGNIYTNALRVGYYFMPVAMLLIPGAVARMEPRLRVVAKLAVIVFFVGFGLLRFYGSTWAMAYPYYWFWQIR